MALRVRWGMLLVRDELHKSSESLKEYTASEDTPSITTRDMAVINANDLNTIFTSNCLG